MWVNEWTRPRFIERIYFLSCESFIWLTEWDLTALRLHYLAVQQAMVSAHRPLHSKITVTYVLTWQTDHWRVLYTPENGFQSVTKCQGGLFLSFAQTFSVLVVWINCQNGVGSHYSTALHTVDYATTGVDISTIHLRSIKSTLPSLYLLHHSHEKNTRPSPAFLYCKRRKAGRGLGTRLADSVNSQFILRLI